MELNNKDYNSIIDSLIKTRDNLSIKSANLKHRRLGSRGSTKAMYNLAIKRVEFEIEETVKLIKKIRLIQEEAYE